MTGDQVLGDWLAACHTLELAEQQQLRLELAGAQVPQELATHVAELKVRVAGLYCDAEVVLQLRAGEAAPDPGKTACNLPSGRSCWC